MSTRRRALVVVLASVTLAGLGSAAQSQNGGRVRDVSMPGKVFAPGVLRVLVGDTVVWRNADGTNHTATSDDDLFDSGFIGPGLTFAQVFSRVGRFKYHCSIHKFMRGEVVVVPVALSAPDDPIVSGGRVVLRGLAPTGTPKVIVRRTGKGGKVLGRAVPTGDGSFTVRLRVFRPENVVAVAQGRASPVVHLAISPKVRARRNGDVVVARLEQARGGARAVLQRYERERFMWLTIERGRLDGTSRVSFRLPGRLGRYRVVVRGDHGWADGASGTVVVRR
jgi:plastocyanin